MPCSLGTTKNICNSLQKYFPTSSSFSSNLTEPLISKNELYYSSSFLQDISSTISHLSNFSKSIIPKKSMNSKIIFTDVFPTENLFEQSKSTKSHISYASSLKTSMLDSLSYISCLDLPSSSSFVSSNVSNSRISKTSSPYLKHSNSLNSSSTLKKINEENESNSTILASEIQGPRIYFSNIKPCWIAEVYIFKLNVTLNILKDQSIYIIDANIWLPINCLQHFVSCSLSSSKFL